MKDKDSKKIKNVNNQSNNSTNNKHAQDYFSTNILLPKNKNAKSTNNQSNSNIIKVKTQDSKSMSNNNNQYKTKKSITNFDNDKQTTNGKEKEKEKEKENKKNKIYILPNIPDKIGSGKKSPRIWSNKQKIPIKLDNKKKDKIIKKNSDINNCKSTFFKNKDKDNNKEKNKKIDNGCKSKNEIINEKKEDIKKNEQIYENEENINYFNTKKLLDFFISLTPIDASKCEDLIYNNMNKVMELESKIGEIIKLTKYNKIKILNEENENLNGKKNSKNNKISINQNIQIINLESNMRKDIYKLFFEFIKQLLEQINFLSNNIANKNMNNLNLIDTYSNNDLFINNASSINNNSLFISNIEEEFCERLINITKSFVSSDIDLSDLNSNLESRNNIFNFSNGGKMNYDENNNIITNFENIPKLNDNEDNNKIIDYNNNEYNCIFRSNTNRKMFMIHPNEILDKIQNEDKKDRKVLHHYSNSLKVNSNLEKLEGKINNDDDNDNIDSIRSLGIEKIKNCYIF